MTTELQAVNKILQSVGTRPVTTLLATSPVDVLLAQQIFSDVTRERQLHGYHWNRIYTKTVAPDVSGFIAVSSTWLRVDTRAEDSITDVVKVGLQLFDRINDTNVFTSALKVTVLVERALTDIPEEFIEWIIAESSRKFQAIQQGDARRDGQLRGDERDAKAIAMTGELRNVDANILNGYGPARSATHRRRTPRRLY
jgi:hypothetical protein